MMTWLGWAIIHFRCPWVSCSMRKMGSPNMTVDAFAVIDSMGFHVWSKERRIPKFCA